MNLLLLGRKDIAKSEEMIASLNNLGHGVDFVLFPGFHYTSSMAKYETSWGDIAFRPTASRLLSYFSHLIRVVLLLKKKTAGKSYDILFAVDWFEALMLIAYKKLFRKNGKIIFYSYDYYFYDAILSSRFFINKIDAFVARHADEIWNVNENIAKERAKAGIVVKHQKTVPLGIASQRNNFVINNNRHFLFVGSFKEGHNLLKLIEVFAELHKEDKNYQLTLIGKGNLEVPVREKIQALDAQQYIFVRGFVSQGELLDEIQAGKYATGLALYENTREVRCVDPGKIKDYLGWGLPVVTTPYSSMAKDIQVYNLGWTIEDDKMILEKFFLDINIKELLSKKKHLQKYVSEHSFEYTFQENLLNM